VCVEPASNRPDVTVLIKIASLQYHKVALKKGQKRQWNWSWFYMFSSKSQERAAQ